MVLTINTSKTTLVPGDLVEVEGSFYIVRSVYGHGDYSDAVDLVLIDNATKLVRNSIQTKYVCSATVPIKVVSLEEQKIPELKKHKPKAKCKRSEAEWKL